ncbi:MAG: transcription antitermination factor NusB [Alphaproteobacteria bacterium]|nr:transcription antitermination factor NusB [Alphaproteobacteria bacterium]
MKAPNSAGRRAGQAARPSPAPRRPSAAGASSRVAAAELLHLVLEENSDLETALQNSETYRGLAGPDRGFARAIASASLRGLGRIHWALGALVDRPLDQIESPVKILLIIGCAQLWLMGVPDHAAVSATVEAARSWRPARRGGGMVNAVLRRASREEALFETSPLIAIWPDWLAARMKAALGNAGADALAALQLEEPPIDLSLKPGENPQTWADRLGGEDLPNGSVRLMAGINLTESPGYAEGAWWVQDAGAALAARLWERFGARTSRICALRQAARLCNWPLRARA